MILDSPSAAVVYDVEFDGQSMEIRLEYDGNGTNGVDEVGNGKAAEFVEQITDALEDKAEVKAEEKTAIAN